jgi:hypothetical protein
MWLKASALSQYRGLFVGASPLWGLTLSSAGGNPLAYLWEATGDEYDAPSGLVMTVGAWHFAAMAVTTTDATLYLGTPSTGTLASWTNTKTHTAKAVAGTHCIGADRLIGLRYWGGSVNDVALFDRALSAAELFALYNLSRAGYPIVLGRVARRLATAAVGGGGAFKPPWASGSTQVAGVQP